MAVPPVSEIRELLSRGEYLLAVDAGTGAIGDQPHLADVELVWITALALARSGATRLAERLVVASDLLARASSCPDRLAEDIGALWARLTKDRALRATGSDQTLLAMTAAERYRGLIEPYQSAYAAVNAATLFLLGGDREAADEMADVGLGLLGGLDATQQRLYWNLASRAEAHLVHRNVAAAAESLSEASAADPDWAMRATTLRQLGLVCRLNELGDDVLAALPVPSVVHYSGHMFRSGPEARLKERIGELLREGRVGAAYGSLACGADLLIAETALAHGAELHVTLPCSVEEFIARSVSTGGSTWVDRWHAVAEQATTMSVEETSALEDEAMFAFCDQLAMGKALIRSRQLCSRVFQIAVWDGRGSQGVAGTAAAVERWRALEGATSVIDLAREDFEPVSAGPAVVGGSRQRHLRGILFADIKGFSQLAETQLPEFFEGVMAALAEVLRTYGEGLLYRNTWGDALYLVFSETGAAAACALDLQDRLAELAEETGWEGLTARIGGHAGPVFDGYDYVCDEPTFYGSHVTRAARIEPRTPPGEVYVTADFAALVAVSGRTDLHVEYVGQVPTAKDYGAFPMYLLMR
jgi:class 3 adenylate cyclase